VADAERGRSVLLVSMDPAHSLADVFNWSDGARARPRAPRGPAGAAARPGRRIATRRGTLHALELDADRALRRWVAERRRLLRTILARGTYLDEEDIDRFLALALPGVDELVGLLELRRLASRDAWDLVVVDTAPTGHTLRLLATPDTLARIARVLDTLHAKHRFLAESLGGAWRPDAAERLIAEVAGDAAALQALLRDPDRARFSWVFLPETPALEEARDGIAALEAAGLAVGEVIVNRLTPPPRGGCARCADRRRHELAVLAEARRALAGRRFLVLPDLGGEPRGLAALRAVAVRLGPAPERLESNEPAAPHPPNSHPSARVALDRGATAEPDWLGRLAPPGLRLLVVTGKGGVGKTTCAAALALALAVRRRTLLLSTDPAHSLADVLALPVGREAPSEVPAGGGRLQAWEFDAEGAWRRRRQRYREAVDEVFDALRGGSRFDAAFDRAIVRDLFDLAPPGLDEVFGVLAVIEALGPPAAGASGWQTVVLDTAPTGHALRLLAMPEAALEWVHALLAVLLKYRKVIGLGELAVDLVQAASDLRRLIDLLSDPARTRAVVVSRAADLPRLETRRLLRALRRLQVPVGALVVNAVTASSGCARCRRAARAERRALAALAADRRLAGARCATILAPGVVPPPRGPEALASWRDGWCLGGRRGGPQVAVG
jgi:arsenite-transporting ATPase